MPYSELFYLAPVFSFRPFEREFSAMLSFYSDIEARYAANRFPKGGVAPLRHELALHDYLEHQVRLAERTQTIDGPAIFGTAFRRVVRFKTHLIGQTIAMWPKEYRFAR